MTSTGTLWFTDLASDKIGKISPHGDLTEYVVPTEHANVRGITIGPDGYLWFAEMIGRKIGRITPDGKITEFSLGPCKSPSDIVAGSDSLWFKIWSSKKAPFPFAQRCPEYSAIGRITTAGSITEFPLNSNVGGIAVAPGGSLWFTQPGSLGRITDRGTVSVLPLAAVPEISQLLAAPDGSLWLSDWIGRTVSHVETSGTPRIDKTFQLRSRAGSVAIDAHGRIWFTDPDTNSLGGITSDGEVFEKELTTRNAYPDEITFGSDGVVWFTEYNVGRVGRFVPTASSTTAENVVKAPTQYVFPLKAGLFTISIPSDVYERQMDVKHESSEFGFYDTPIRSPLFKLVEGGGTYDFRSLEKTCLNGSIAWRTDGADSGTVLMGEPGSWIAVSWSGLSADRLSRARTIISSMNVNFGPTC